MNKQEALEQLKWLRNKSQLRVDRDFTEPLDMAISALEKQIPKKVTEYKVKNMKMGYICPKCSRLYQTSLDFETKYCDECGQKLDWSVEK